MSLFFERFLQLCHEYKTAPNAVAAKLNLSSGSVTAWKRGTMPRTDTVQKLAKYFHVTSDYLIGNVNEPYFHLDNTRILREINSYGDEKAPTSEGRRNISDDELMFALFGDVTYMDADDLADVRRYADFVKERKQKK